MEVKSKIKNLLDLAKDIEVSRPSTAAYRLLNLSRTGNSVVLQNTIIRLGYTIKDQKSRKRFIDLIFELYPILGWQSIADTIAAGLLKKEVVE